MKKNEKAIKKIGNYCLLKQLGKGTMGEVYLTQKDGSNEYYATKAIDKKKADRPQVRKYFINEISILKELKHKKIVRFYDLKQTTSHYYIVMEYCNGGSLLNCLVKYKEKYKKPFSEEIVQYLMRQIVSGLKYIHKHGIIHRDIKLDNILVKFYNEEDSKNINMLKTHVKISDFGISIKPGENHLAQTLLGSPANMDPYILKKLTERNDLAESEGYDQSADIWSLGSSCYEMLIGKRVFNGRNVKDLSKKVEKGNYILPTNLSKEVVSFINGMLQYDPKKRLNIEQLSRHHFLTRRVKDFSPIDFSLILNKVDEKGIIMNTKDNKTMWKVFNSNNTGIVNNSTIINKNNNVNNITNMMNNININNNTNNKSNNLHNTVYNNANYNAINSINNINDINNQNMWNIFDKETELKLSMIPKDILDQVPFQDNDATDNVNDNNQQLKNMNFNQANIITNNTPTKQNNLNDQNQHYNSDNKINRFNYNMDIANSQYPGIPKYPKEFSNANLNRINTTPNGKVYNGISQEQFGAATVSPQNNYYNNFNQGNPNYSQLNQTQITTNKYVGDIRIKKEIANNDEICMHQ